MAFRTLRATTRTAFFYTQRARAFSSSSPCLYPPSRSNSNDDERLTTAKAGDTPGAPAPAAPAFGFSALCLPSLTTPVTVGKVTVGKGVLATSPAAAVSPLLAKFLMVAPPLAAQVVFLAPMGAMRTFKKEKTTGAVSPINLAAMCVNGIVWISYGAMRSDPTIWAPNITAFLFGSYYLYTFNQYKAKGVSMTPSLAGVAAASLATGGVIATFDPATAGDIIGHAGIGIVAVMFGWVEYHVRISASSE